MCNVSPFWQMVAEELPKRTASLHAGKETPTEVVQHAHVRPNTSYHTLHTDSFKGCA